MICCLIFTDGAMSSQGSPANLQQFTFNYPAGGGVGLGTLNSLQGTSSRCASRSVSRSGSRTASRSGSSAHLLSTSDIENHNNSMTDHNRASTPGQCAEDRPLT